MSKNNNKPQRKWSRFEKAVLLALYRIERREEEILCLLKQTKNEVLAQRLNTSADQLQDAVNRNKP